MTKHIKLITNDDGIYSPGLMPLVAPRIDKCQQLQRILIASIKTARNSTNR